MAKRYYPCLIRRVPCVQLREPKCKAYDFRADWQTSHSNGSMSN